MHAHIGGRITPEERMHLTLAFLGNVGPAELARLLRPSPAVALTPFRVTLDTWGCWVHNKVGWAAPSHAPAALGEFVSNLESWLSSTGFEREGPAFTPHVTLVRKAHCGELRHLMTPIEWAVAEFALVESVPTPRGPRYETVRIWAAR